MCMRWTTADRPQSSMSLSSRTSLSRSLVPVASTTLLSASPTLRTKPGPSVCATWASSRAAPSTASISGACISGEPNGILFEIATDGPGFSAE